MFHQEFHIVGIHGMMEEENQGIEVLSIKEAVEGSLDDLNG